MKKRICVSILLTMFILTSASSLKCLAQSENGSLITGTWRRIIAPEEKYTASATVVFSEDGTLWGSSEYQGIDLSMTLNGTYKFLADNVVQINYLLTKQYGSGKTEKEQVTLIWLITELKENEMTVEFFPERKLKYTYRK